MIMNRTIKIIIAAAVIIIGAVNAMATEEALYKVSKTDGTFEIRDYAANILAETVVDGDLEGAGSKAFRTLFRYISGSNRSRNRVALTSPVSKEAQGEKISMTAPVLQHGVQENWVVSFTMPAIYSLQTLPEPDDPKITLRQVPAHRMAAVRYSGLWSEKSYLQHKQELESWVHKMGLTISGAPVWARYNAPFTPWFLRRNEILIPITAGDETK
jgi:SOUL heme-binding protein